MSAKHTAAPWIYRPREYDDWGWVRSADGAIVACARAGRSTSEDELALHRKNKTDPYEANARLIAAAPELLESLSDVTRTLEAVRFTSGLGKNQVERLAKAKAAIAKAEQRK